MAKKKTPAGARVALDTSKMTVAEKVAAVRASADAIDANTATFNNPPIPTATLRTQATVAETAEAGAKTARQTSILKTSQRDDAVDLLDISFNTTGKYVDLVAAGRASVIAQASMRTRGTPVRMTTAPAAPLNFLVKSGTKPGEASASWKKSPGAGAYVLQAGTNPNDPSTMKTVGQTSGATKITLTALPSGKVWLQVAATGAHGTGPWSDPATCTVA